MLDFVKSLFFASINIIERLFFFILLMFRITLSHVLMLNQSCIPGTNPTWSWHIIPFLYCWVQFDKVLLRSFTSVFRSIQIRGSLFLISFFLVWYVSNATFIESIQKYFFFSIFWVNVIDWMFVFSPGPQIHMLNSKPQCNGVGGRGLWEVVRTWGWSPVNGISALMKEARRAPLPFPPCKDAE